MTVVRALVFTTLYPNPEEPGKATFLRDRVRHVAVRPDVELEVVAPVPWFPRIPLPPRFERWAKFARVPRAERRDGISVAHPRYPLVPKVGMGAHGEALYRGALRCVRAIRRRFPFEVIDAHYLYPDGWAAIRLGRALGVPVVLSARGTDAHTFPEIASVRPKIVHALREARSVIAVSRELAGRVEALTSLREPVVVIPNGVDTDRFRPAERREARAGLGLPCDGRLVVSVGRLTPVKGHDLLLRAFGELPVDSDGGPRLAIVGDGELRSALERRAAELGVGARVLFAGERSQEELAAWYGSADALCLASFREGWPNVLMESLACGTPVVSTRVGGAPEIVDDAELGVLVPPDDPEALARGLREVLDRSFDRDRLVEVSRRRSWSETAARVAEVLRRASR